MAYYIHRNYFFQKGYVLILGYSIWPTNVQYNKTQNVKANNEIL